MSQTSELMETQVCGSMIWSPDTLAEMMDAKGTEKLEEMGGLEALASGLGTNLKDGISGADAAYRQAKYGFNRIDRSPPASLPALVLATIRTRILGTTLILALGFAAFGLLACASGIGAACPRKPFWSGPIDPPIADDIALPGGACDPWLRGAAAAAGCLALAFAAAWEVLGSERRLHALQCRQDGSGTVTVRRSGMAVLLQTDQVAAPNRARNVCAHHEPHVPHARARTRARAAPWAGFGGTRGPCA
jgi:hypothetical protein